MSYDGGKGGAGVYQTIINQLPQHQRFISLFLGNCAVMRYKKPAQEQIGIEINPCVIKKYWQSKTQDITVINDDALNWIHQNGARLGKETMIYADPPYLLSTRSSQRRIYQYEMMEIEEHRALLQALCNLRCNIAISGYWSAIYELELAGWRAIQFQTVKRSGEKAEEWLWMNYQQPAALHDYRYLGATYRQRERLKRKKERWTRRLEAMDPQERAMLIQAIAELKSPETTIQAYNARNGDAGATDETP